MAIGEAMVERANLGGTEKGAREGVQQQGAQGDFAHLWVTAKKAGPAGAADRQWFGDNA